MFNYLFNAWALKEKYATIHKQLETELKPAYTRNARECVNCHFCCWVRPPFLTKDDLKRLGTAQQMSPEVYFKNYCVVDNINQMQGIVLIRKNQKQYAGKWLPCNETYNIASPCYYLDDVTGCQIHSIKPKMCKSALCTHSDKEKRDILNDLSDRDWSDSELNKLGWSGEKNDD